MGFRERRAGAQPHRPAGPQARYGAKPGPSSGGSNDPLFDPSARRSEPAPRGGRTDLIELLGRTVLEARVQRVCQEYGLTPRDGGAVGLSRSYLARDAGVELAADLHGTITTVFLHFLGDDGFRSFHGELPGDGGTIPRRAALRAKLGEPRTTGDPYRDRFLGDFGPWDGWLLGSVQLRAQYALDGESLQRITLTIV